MRVNDKEPDRSKPCWVLLNPRKTKKGHGLVVQLEEFAWVDGAWRRTGKPVLFPNTLKQGLEKADWVGRLPQMGRNTLKRKVKTGEVELLSRSNKTCSLQERSYPAHKTAAPSPGATAPQRPRTRLVWSEELGEMVDEEIKG